MSIFYSREKDGTLNVHISGKVTQAPKLSRNEKNVNFSVSYGKSKYMNCEAWADSHAGDIAARLEVGDVVSMDGIHRTWEYNDKTYQSVTIDYISVMGTPETAPQDFTEPTLGVTYEDLQDDDGELPF